ncbi:hypothetical protein EFK50_01155 [Nocardioides marmoriginsengisoli]|uniref:HNH endonuclease 5 domain-containing protein n=1 Tax=Nocardioides marmoriginsengisoli TaxID=661483 RepID=A0A3N0CS11_9ACTN|nr:HNH endonuclease [Nocardioides marmoriginsengisoli]RNL66264.1 hypothetical protein EFK50_01155 [Nocardioides marmoriginsengisoli]
MSLTWAKKRRLRPRSFEDTTPATSLTDTALTLLEDIRGTGNLGRYYNRNRAITLTGLTRDQVKFAEQDIRGSVFAGQFRPLSRIKIPKRTRAYVYNRDGWACVLCDCRDQEQLTLGHHPIPYSRGGSDHHTNLRTECTDCNNAAGDTEQPPITLEESA